MNEPYWGRGWYINTGVIHFLSVIMEPLAHKCKFGSKCEGPIVCSKSVLTEIIEKYGDCVGDLDDSSITYLKFYKNGELVQKLEYDDKIAQDSKPNADGYFEVGVLDVYEYDSVDIYLLGYLPEVFTEKKFTYSDLFLGDEGGIKTRLSPFRFKYTMDLTNIATLHVAFPTVLPNENKRDDYYDVNGSYEFNEVPNCSCY